MMLKDLRSIHKAQFILHVLSNRHIKEGGWGIGYIFKGLATVLGFGGLVQLRGGLDGLGQVGCSQTLSNQLCLQIQVLLYLGIPSCLFSGLTVLFPI